MSVRTSFNKKPKVVKKELTYSSFVNSLSRDDFYEEGKLLEKTLELLPAKQRVDTVITFMEKTPYSAFAGVMKNLKRLYARYLEFGNKSELKTYIDNLVNDGQGGMHRSLLLVRESIVRDLLHDNVKDTVHGVQEMIYGIVSEQEPILDDMEMESAFDVRMKEYLIHAAGYIWPEAKGLKVLFGGQK